MKVLKMRLAAVFLQHLQKPSNNLSKTSRLAFVPRLHFHSGSALRQQSGTHVKKGQLKLQESHLELNDYFQEPAQFWYIWLRDHCQCDLCYNHTTHQRNLNILTVPSDIKPQNCWISNDQLLVEWADKHLSKFSLDWLYKNNYNTHYQKLKNQKPVLWYNTVNLLDDAVDATAYLEDENYVKKVLQSLVRFGVGFVKNVPATVDATEKIVTRISHVQRTMFGDMWVLDDRMVHSDTAYTKQSLCAHTDNTYFTEPAGLQVFHCVHHDGEGGRTLLVDGFRAAEDVKKTHPESYRRLCTTPVEFRYLEKGRHYSFTGPILNLNAVTKDIEHIRFNLLDRAPFSSVPTAEVKQFYEDIRILASEISKPEGEMWIKLSPGLVLFIDNWRVLHGREAFSGYRKLTGCYIGRSDFLSKARVLGVL
ncbi:trimethyllysine dioxygenase, mitochondrial isoform X1 [Schistocerca nitens]|uniref:trimethyllysine dioxygenase, mitochondrial isoform X1 n=2 Tax=Schistocerca nitens TaxID=7011 RepID=UPI0021199E1B|nr:trimethyllysine dioxygenase, mitochondrial isoform X1 [Schistocerca nitens]